MSEAETMEEKVPFDVNDAVEVGDLNEVRKDLTPQAQNVKVKIAKCSTTKSKDGNLKALKPELKIVDGIMVTDPDTGLQELKFVGKVLFPGFMDLCIWANPEVKVSNWYKTKQHLLGFKQFCQALEIDLKNVKVDDEFCSGLIDRELLVSITHEEETIEDPETGKRIKTGNFQERVRNFRKAA